MQRWALTLSAYHYDIVFKNTGEHENADSLSRLPLPQPRKTSPDPMVPFIVGEIQALPVTAKKVEELTQNDPLFSRVLGYVRSGWPDRVTEVNGDADKSCQWKATVCCGGPE